MALYVDNDHRIEITGLKDEDGNSISGATVEATVYEENAKTKVSGVTFPVVLSEESSGNYAGTLGADAGLEITRTYWVRVTAVKSGKRATWWSMEVAQRRTFSQ